MLRLDKVRMLGDCIESWYLTPCKVIIRVIVFEFSMLVLSRRIDVLLIYLVMWWKQDWCNVLFLGFPVHLWS